jgi:hypothetical protein
MPRGRFGRQIVTIRFEKGPIRIGEVWYGDQPSGEVDLVRHRMRPQPVAGGRCEPFNTLFVDLTQPEDTLLNAIAKGTRQEIRRAAKDGVTCEVVEGARVRELVGTFVTFFNEFSRGKGLPEIPRAIIDPYVAAGVLDLSRVVRAEDGATLVWHAYYRSATHARLLRSASLFRASGDSAFRSLVGRANRLLHWEDMRRLKQGGLSVYDLGGFWANATDPVQVGINKFKEEFGGRVVGAYECEEGVTLKGKLFLHAKRLRELGGEGLETLRAVRASLRPPTKPSPPA